ncbi:MAG: phosphoribosylamine--glycine ligase [Thermodesulfobacteriota bacterium]
MKLLIVGGGGREHALAWKMAQSPEVEKIFCAPGNAGIAGLAECIAIKAENIDALTAFAAENEIDLTVVGPEAPLVGGIVEAFEKAGLKAFGPSGRAAALEGSKSYAKWLMEKYNIPTAAGRTFSSYEQARLYIRDVALPIVVKADGLAAGKGVTVCATREQAEQALKRIMADAVFGDAGSRVVIEQCLSGEEASFIALTDGKTVLPLPASQDHKTIDDNDEGPNTGGMGAYSPAPVVDAVMRKKIMDQVMIPTVNAMAAEGRPYKGVLYAGLIIDGDRVQVVEFNCRFGDPETQPQLMRIQNDIVPLMMAAVDGGLGQYKVDIDPRPSVCVVMAAKGYPGAYSKGMPVSGLDRVEETPEVAVFHAGTSEKDGRLVTDGGRVLGVTALGDDIATAISRAYRAVSAIFWEEEHHRTDIGKKALDRQHIAPAVGIIMGSDSDFGVMAAAGETLKRFGIPYEMTVASAHRTPERAAAFAEGAAERGIQVIIAGAGHAAHLAGVLAAHTPLPVIGVPIDSSALSGFDSLLSTVQMPPGIPVATMAVGKPGAKNAGVFAAQILAASDPAMQEKIRAHKAQMAKDVDRKAESFDG